MKKIFTFLFLIIGSIQQVFAHSVQIAYCVDCAGNLRIFVEHWHGSANPNSTSMTIQLNIGGVITTQTNPPAFGILAVPFGSLPGCATPITVAGSCSGSANAYNDWVIYDYFGIPQGVPCSFTILSGNNSFTSDGCGMYPLTVNFTIPPGINSGTLTNVCQGGNTPVVNVPVGVNWTNNNTATGLSASGTGPIASFVPSGLGSSVISYATGCGTTSNTITVVAGPVASFNTSAPVGGVCLGTNVNFTNTTPGGIGWTWNFGDGTTSNLQNPSHLYSAPGTYIVQLNVNNGTPCPGIITKTVVINPMPIPAFTIGNACQNTAITINNTSNIASGTMNYAWTMTGGTPNSSTSSGNPVVTYAASGAYNVNLTLTSNNGCVASVSHPVTIFGRAVPNFSATSVCFNSPTNFTNLTTTTLNPGTGAVASYSWVFGATSGTSSATSPVNTYTNPANQTANTVYTATLFATTANGCTDQAVNTVTVYSLPTATFVADSVCITNPTTLSNVGSNNGNPYFGFNWSCSASTSGTITNIFPTPGNTSVTYTAITSPNGGALQCKSVFTKNIWVKAGPVAVITNTNACFGLPIGLSGITSTIAIGTITNYAWAYGNGASSLVNPTPSTSVIYNPSGVYSVTLTVGSNQGCSGLAVKNVTAFGRAVVDFGPTNVCFNTPTAFTNSTSTTVNANTGSIASYSWNFGATSGTSSATNPVNTYTNPANATANTVYTVDLYATTSNGCTDVLSKTITVYSLPTPTFVADSVCFGNPSTLTNVGNNNGNPYFGFNWSCSASTASTVTSVLPLQGNNSVTYTVITSPDGGITQCKSSFTKNVWVHSTPLAVITNTNKCVGFPIGLSGATSTVAFTTFTNYAWSYGNGTSSLVNPTPSTSVSYTPSGTYNVSLTVTSAKGCTNTAVKTVTAFGRAVIDFGPVDVCYNTPTAFTNSTSTTINANTSAVASWSWNFGATAGSSTLMNPTITYTNPANATANITYSATLFATTADGCKDSLTKTLTVYSLPTPNFISDSVCLGNQTTLTDISNSNGNPFTLFKWDFNSDGIADVTNMSLSTQTIFPNFGNNSVTYTVVTTPNSTSLSCYARITKNVWVNPLPVAALTTNNQCLDTQPVNISGANSNIAIGTVTNYAWAYGDGNNSLINSTSPTSHSYSAAGNYVITLTVTSNKGCTGINTNTVDVWERPYAHFSYTKTCLTKTTTLQAYQEPVSGTIVSYQWDFNNNTSNIEATGIVVTNTFLAAGINTVNMVLTTDKGCNNIIPGVVYINYRPQPKFYSPRPSSCAPLCTNIIDSSAALTGPGANSVWEWTFGNGQSITYTNQPGNSTNICYQNSSNFTLKSYSIRLILKSDSGCVDSITKKNYITAFPNPKADFDWSGDDGTILTPLVNFTNTSLGYSAYKWGFSDGTPTDSTHRDPSHYYVTDATVGYNVFLAVRNQYGCKDTTMKVVDIGPNFSFYIPNAFTPNDDGINDTFSGKGIGIKTYDMWIFDRWGEMVYYTNDINNGWNGSIKGNKLDTKMDVYQWKVLISDLNNKKHEYVGHVSLIK